VLRRNLKGRLVLNVQVRIESTKKNFAIRLSIAMNLSFTSYIGLVELNLGTLINSVLGM
jgi:hypothetical protein